MAEGKTVFAMTPEEQASERLDFFGEAVCALKPAFRNGYNAAAAAFRELHGRSLRGYLPAICGCDGIKGAENIHKVREIDNREQMPPVIVSFNFSDYFYSRFQKKFTGKGYFEQLDMPLHPLFEQGGLRDPHGEFHIFAVMPTVMLVDKKRLGSRPVPRRWADLLDPIYTGSVALSAAHGAVSTLLPLTILRDHGEQGLDALQHTVSAALPSTVMIRNAGSKAEGPAISVVAWFFAKACPNPDVEIVWPEDGALVEPMFLLVQKGQADFYRSLVDFVTGVSFGQASAAHCYPVANPTVENHLPDGAGFNWLGWEFIRSVPLEERMVSVKARFASLVKE